MKNTILINLSKKTIIIILALGASIKLSAQSQTFSEVGIGTSPDYPLHIHENSGDGTAIMIDADVNANPNIYFRSNGQPAANIRYYDSGNDNFQIMVGSSLESALDITMDGNIGIGETTPNCNLQIGGGDHVYFSLINGDNSGDDKGFFMQRSSTGAGYQNYLFSEDGVLHVAAMNDINLKAMDGGNLFLTADEFISLSGEIDLNDNAFYLRKNSGNTYGLGYNASGGNQMVLFSDDVIEFRESDNNTLRAKFSMNQGKFEFAGEINIASSISSDFVFEDDYKLMSLYEIESFVKEHKHLPEVPSVEEFKETGQNLGEMDDLLLRKIEELTLYIIEQQKEIDELKKQLKKNN